jgi:nucleotide-binding universal stress UspA family protein
MNKIQIRKERTFNKIIWAINPLDSNPKLFRSMIKLLRNFDRLKAASIEPVFVYKPLHLRSVVGFATEAALLKRIQRILKIAQLKSITKPKLLEIQQDSHRMATKTLIDYALTRRASMIAVATHARKGIPKFMLGSFAESLLLLSPLPLIFVNPYQQKPRRISKILFPTNFGKQSKRAFATTLDLAEELKAQLSVFCAIQNLPYEGTLFMSDIGGFPMTVGIDETSARDRAQEFLRKARLANITVEYLSQHLVGSVSHAILKQTTKNKFDLVSIAAEPRPRIPLLIGSTTRQIIRQAPCPVYVFRPKA